MIERTLSVIKPDAVRDQVTGAICAIFESHDLKIVAHRRLILTEEQAAQFYAAHKERAFFSDLVAYMTSGPVLAQVLEGPDAIALNRRLMGATNPASADEGTIRKLYGKSVEANAVHGSDSPESAKTEIAFFFAQIDIVAP